MNIMTKRNQRRLTVWLGLVAMWLLVVAPLVSNVLLAARADGPHGPLCSATSQFENPNGRGVGEHSQHAVHGDACCYCHLLEHHAVVPGTPLAAIYLACIVVVLAVATFAQRCLSAPFYRGAPEPLP
ncbi:DUF2946 domain-containing protein [Pandoraea apista]|nr:DUF2946 domain-containing protein [Pandoraea apista]